METQPIENQKWALVLGAKSDMARACAHEFAKLGYSILLAGRKKEELEADASDLHLRYHVESRALSLDITDTKTHASFYKNLPASPEVVLSFVGYLGDGESSRHDSKEAIRIMETNYLGPAHFLGIVADDMEARKKGSIIGVGSVAGDRGRQSNYVYGSAKAGFAAFLSGLRHRLYKSGVHVMTVKPGFVATAMTAELELPGALTASPEAVARDILKAFRKKTDVLYTLWFWKWIMWIIIHLPGPIFKRSSL